MTKPPRLYKRDDTPLAYEDVKFILELALKKPGLMYECSTNGAATQFKQRCNKFRKMLRQQAAEIDGAFEGYRPEISYDVLVIRQTNAEGKSDNYGQYLKFDRQAPLGRIIDPETGEDISIDLGQEIIKGEH